MKLKFTLQRPGGSAVDLLAQVDATATVGDLAHYIAGSDPDNSRGISVPDGSTLTLALTDQTNVLLDPRQLIAEAPLASGETVTVSVASQGYQATGALTDAPAVLRVVNGPDQGKEFPLSAGSSIIGRDPGCDIVLTDPMVSRRHARINVSDTVEVIDQGSANGVEVGGNIAPRAILRATDVVSLGDTEFTVTLLHRAERGQGPVAFVRRPVIRPVHEGPSSTCHSHQSARNPSGSPRSHCWRR